MDVGPQYRSAIFFTTPKQEKAILALIKKINEEKGGDEVVTEVNPLDVFYEAKGYHKDYYEKNKAGAYCQLVINPKLEKIQKKFADILKAGE